MAKVKRRRFMEKMVRLGKEGATISTHNQAPRPTDQRKHRSDYQDVGQARCVQLLRVLRNLRGYARFCAGRGSVSTVFGVKPLLLTSRRVIDLGRAQTTRCRA